eukprot:TRINITY_DN7452_c0_g1_i1.p1 TRINITY_DN7452_c0_g1~~TRINITY_DN7452_c0_g1_i1.p1  ORF type:complete len:381 (+),score=93.71 TRINITY_DN7452_c0_g1_i1:180-1322(+)
MKSVIGTIGRSFCERQRCSSVKSCRLFSTRRQSMKAVLLTGYGPTAEVFRLAEVPIPALAAHEVLIEVHASAINPIDAVMRNGYGRTAFETQRPLPAVLGRECSGRVVAIGNNVWNFKVGDEVFAATSPLYGGMHAEFAAVSEHHMALKPQKTDHYQTATMGYAPLTALAAMDFVEYRRGLPVLVEGASGAAGSFAVQYLKLQGCHVTGTCSARNVDYVKSLGADVVWDYAAPPGSSGARDDAARFDLVLDFGGGHAVPDAFNRLRPGGHLVSASSDLVRLIDTHGIVPGVAAHLAQLASEKLVQKTAFDVNFDWAYFRESTDRLHLVAGLADAEQIKFAAPRVFTPEQFVEAFDYVDSKPLAPAKAVFDFSSRSESVSH